jgi:hypothetical protein
MFDPAAHAPGGLTGMRVAPESLARFTAVLGMALAEADRRPPIVDFLNVRRKVEKKRFGRQHAIAATTAALLLLAVVAAMWRQHYKVAAELDQVQAEIKGERDNLNKLKPHIDLANAVGRWDATDVNWLDVMKTVSETLRERPINLSKEDHQKQPYPVRSDVMVKTMLLTRPTAAGGVGGEIKLVSAAAKDAAAVHALVSRLRRNDRLSVDLDFSREDKTNPDYPWAFGLSVKVEKPPENALATSSDAKVAGATPADKTEAKAADEKKAAEPSKSAEPAKTEEPRGEE